MFLCAFFWAPRHEEVLGEWKYSSTYSLTSALDGGEWSASCPVPFIHRQRAPDTHWIGGRVGPRARLDTVAKRKNPLVAPCREMNPVRPVLSLVSILSELSGS
jgi:hypothetical protein